MGRFCFSISSDEDGARCPVSASADCNAGAQQSRMKLWGCFLLCFLQLKAWSPQASWILLHGHFGSCSVLNIGSLSFRLMAKRKLQFGCLLDLLDLFIEISGYEVCGTRMLGRRWMCSGALIKVDSYVRSVSAWAQYCLMRDRMLCGDSFSWKW